MAKNAQGLLWARAPQPGPQCVPQAPWPGGNGRPAWLTCPKENPKSWPKGGPVTPHSGKFAGGHLEARMELPLRRKFASRRIPGPVSRELQEWDRLKNSGQPQWWIWFLLKYLEPTGRGSTLAWTFNVGGNPASWKREIPQKIKARILGENGRCPAGSGTWPLEPLLRLRNYLSDCEIAIPKTRPGQLAPTPSPWPNVMAMDSAAGRPGEVGTGSRQVPCLYPGPFSAPWNPGPWPGTW